MPHQASPRQIKVVLYDVASKNGVATGRNGLSIHASSGPDAVVELQAHIEATLVVRRYIRIIPRDTEISIVHMQLPSCCPSLQFVKRRLHSAIVVGSEMSPVCDSNFRQRSDDDIEIRSRGFQ